MSVLAEKRILLYVTFILNRHYKLSILVHMSAENRPDSCEENDISIVLDLPYDIKSNINPIKHTVFPKGLKIDKVVCKETLKEDQFRYCFLNIWQISLQLMMNHVVLFL